MDKKFKLTLLILISILISQSFTKIYTDFKQYKFLSSFESNATVIRFDYSLKETINEDKSIEKLNQYLIDNNFILFNFKNYPNNIFEYYSPTNIDKWNNKIEEYKSKCGPSCFTTRQMSYKDLNVSGSYSITGENKISHNDISNNIPYLIVVDEIQDDVHAISDTAYFINEYKLYILLEILIIFSIIFIFYFDFFKELDKIILYSIYGYSFISFLKYFFKNRFLIPYSFLVMLSTILFIIRQKTLESFFAIVILNILIFCSITLILVPLKFLVFNNIRKKLKYNILYFSVAFSSIILSIFIVLAVSLLSTLKYNFEIKNNIETSNNVLDNYYQVEFDQSINFEDQILMSETLLNEYNATSIQFIEQGIDPSSGSKNKLVVDKFFLEDNPQIKNINGSDIILDNESKVYILTTGDELDFSYFKTQDIFEIIYVTDDGRKYNTFDLFIPYTELNETLIEVIQEYPLISNVYLQASSENEAIKVYQDIYSKYNVETRPIIHKVTYDSFEDELQVKTKSSIYATILSILCIVIATSFYTLLIFTKYKTKIILSYIYGYNKIVIFKNLICEIAIVFSFAFVTLFFIFNISIFEYAILLLIFIFEIILMYFSVQKLLKKSVINFIKGEI